VVAFCGGSALDSHAQPAPHNDDLTNAQVILGVSGSVQATNINATVEAGELAPVNGVPAQSTIWYIWTAPITTTVDFNTRNSTDPDGLPLDTMLGIYTNSAPGQPVSFANLVEVTGNEDDPSGGVTSRVDFQALQGTNYYIQVGSTTNTADGYSQGFVHLNWGASLVAGLLALSQPTFFMSSLENWLPDVDPAETILPSLYGFQEGSANARITLARYGGAVGRCEVNVILSPGTYTNSYQTNFLITNIFVTNYSAYPLTAANETGYTNIFLTNIASVNWFTNFENGFLVGLPVDNDIQENQTNSGTATTTDIGRIEITTNSLTGLNLFDFFANFSCPGTMSIPPTAVSNNGVITVSATNIYCILTNTNVIVPSAYKGIQYAPLAVTNFSLDDFQMSTDIFVQVYPFRNDTRLVRRNQGPPAKQRLPTPIISITG
jgi:hypothetical protein